MFNQWWFWAVMSGVILSGRNILFKDVNTKLDAPFSSLILSVVMALCACAYYTYHRISTGHPWIQEQTNLGMLGFLIGAGACLFFANITLALAFQTGGDAGITALLQNGFTIAVTILLGMLFFSELVKPMQFAGILLISVGAFLVIKS